MQIQASHTPGSSSAAHAYPIDTARLFGYDAAQIPQRGLPLSENAWREDARSVIALIKTWAARALPAKPEKAAATLLCIDVQRKKERT